MPNARPPKLPQRLPGSASSGRLELVEQTGSGDKTLDNNELNRLASGRRIIHFCLFGWLGMFAFRLNSTPLLLPLLLALSGAALVGSLKVIRALGISRSAQWICALGAAVPFAGVLVMGWMSSRARGELLKSGWRLGMFQAYRPGQDRTSVDTTLNRVE